MTQRKSVRKAEVSGRPNLRLVPKPKRRRWKLPRNLRHMRKSKWHPELLRYEEDIVLRAVAEMGGRASVKQLTSHYPGRFNAKPLWWTLLRLADADLLHTASGLGLLHRGRRDRSSIWDGWGVKAKTCDSRWVRSQPLDALAWWERHKPRYHRTFWL